MKENISSGYNTKVIVGNKLTGKNGELVRFWNESIARYCYVPSGTRVSYYDTNLQKNKIVTITKNTSEIYKVDNRLPTDKKATSNHDIDHFLILDNDDILAITVIGDYYIKVSQEEYDKEVIEW